MTLYLLAEEPVQNHQQQECCLIVEVRAPDGIDHQLVQLTIEDAIKEKFGKSLMLWPATEDEASQYLEADPGASTGALTLPSNVSGI
jgi:hypothetical protein